MNWLLTSTAVPPNLERERWRQFMNAMAEIIRRYGIVPGEALSVDQMKVMTLAVKAGQLKVDHFKQVAEITTSFNMVAVEAAKSFSATIESTGKVKESGMRAFNTIVEALEKIATSTDDAQTKNKVIDCLMKIGNKVEEADKRNHGWAKMAILVIGSVVISAIVRRPVRLA